MSLANIIIKPRLSEKSTGQAETANTYAFQVAPTATKPEIKAAVEELYKVKVKDEDNDKDEDNEELNEAWRPSRE